jgi:hypothetical protein
MNPNRIIAPLEHKRAAELDVGWIIERFVFTPTARTYVALIHTTGGFFVSFRIFMFYFVYTEQPCECAPTIREGGAQ